MNVGIRDLVENDIQLVLDYWYRSPRDFLISMGVDLLKLAQEEEMRNSLLNRIAANKLCPISKLNVLVITFDDQAVGVHPLNPLVENDHGVFHAHIWKPEFRRRGIAFQSYPLACQIFFERFNLKKIVFKTPIQNTGAIRVKEKLGIRQVGFETVNFGIIKDGTQTKVFELTREESQKWVLSHL